MSISHQYNKDMNTGAESVYLELPGGGNYFLEMLISSASDSVSVSLLGSPGEHGTVINDHRVRQPIRVHVEGWVTNDGYSKIKTLYNSTKQEKLEDAMLKFYHKDDEPIGNLLVQNATKRSTTDKLNMVFLSLDLQEFMFEKA